MPSTQPVWQEVTDDRAFRSPLPASIDVCVIGAGIAGLSVAYHLAANGKKVVVVEARSIGSGMTSCTTAHLASALDDRFTTLIRRRGEDAARQGANAHAAAIDAVERIVDAERIDCGFARVSGFLVAASPKDHELLHEEAAAARKLGIDAERLASFPLPGFRGGECLRFPRQGRFEPMAYLQGLARAVVRHGGLIATNTRVRSVEDGTPAKVTTDDGFEIRARAVVVATNSPVNDRVRLHTKQFPYMTYVIGLKVTTALPDALIWDTLDPYHYCRLAGKPGPDGSDTLIVGGEDHKTGQASDGEERFAHLEAWAYTHFPTAGRVTHKWAGQVLETLDGLAHIGRNPGDENVYVVTGDSGMGMTHGTIAGLLIPSLIAGEDHPWKEAFDPGRTPVRGAGEFVSENANAAWQYTDYLTGSEVDSVDVIEPEGGAVVRSGLTKIAVYRDENGDLHKCSAVCPHLGAVVHWNSAEKTWDCPAHGSRFDCEGRVIQGPANTNLTPVQEPASTK
jgi:glycine/D-amino acid oxidase-like deaminating enzyme/nitrite reductase/ring-hydroxylating ferredoxin subunit